MPQTVRFQYPWGCGGAANTMRLAAFFLPDWARHWRIKPLAQRSIDVAIWGKAQYK